jgi:hypothetical protein
MVIADTHALLLGKDDRWTKRWGFGVVALLLGSLVYFAVVKAIGYPTIHLLLWWEGYAVLLLALITVQAYSNEGLVISWMLAFVAVGGLILNYGGIGLTGSGPGLLELVGLAILGGAIAAAFLGTLGFGIGTALRRIAT